MIVGTVLQAVLCCTVLTPAFPALAPVRAHQLLAVSFSLGLRAWEAGLPPSNTRKMLRGVRGCRQSCAAHPRRPQP